MMFTLATLFMTAMTVSAGIVAPPSVPRALGDVIVIQPPQGYVVRAGEAFALHYINKPSDSFVTYETEVGLQRAGRHNIRPIKQFHPITDVVKESITIPSKVAPGRYNLIVTDHRTTFDKDVSDNEALPSYRNQALNVTITVAHADLHLKEL
ncbi:septal pore cap protein SPC18 [Ceratobasidium sp. AG-I]|nr:septal pore cap protein SPC18 [Ceratobasidium sp. AG-I]